MPDHAPNLSHFRRAVHLAPCIFFCLLCCQSGASQEVTSTQRELGQFNSNTLDLTLSISPGLIEGADEARRRLDARATAGVAQLVLRTGPVASGELLLDMENLHPEAVFVARRARRIGSLEALGEQCSEEDFPALDVNCSRDPEHGACAIPTSERLTTTRQQSTIALTPCLEITYDLSVPADDDLSPLSFVVIGSMRDPETLSAIHAQELSLGHIHDFYLLLGDALDGANSERLLAMKARIDSLGTVVIVIPGEEELGEDQGQLFEQNFGAFDYRWTIKETQFVTFYSANQTLSPRGLGSLQSSLRAMQSEDQRWRLRHDETTSSSMPLQAESSRALPAFAITHTPLFDPDGPREAGFQSRLQAGRVASLLAAAGVHTLFAGHILDNAHVTDATPRHILTTSQNTRLDDALGNYRRVTILDEATSSTIPVARKHMLLETLSIP